MISTDLFQSSAPSSLSPTAPASAPSSLQLQLQLPTFTRLEVETYYQRLPPAQQHHLEELTRQFFYARKGCPTDDQFTAQQLKMTFDHHDPRRQPQIGDQVFYPATSTFFSLTEFLGCHPDQRIYLLSDGRVVKWTVDDDPVEDEIDLWHQLSEVGTPLPVYSDDLQLWGSPVLALERLYPLDETDDLKEVGCQLLTILRSVHWLGIHNDIKPDNIMKRPPNTYFLIDFGGMTTIKKYDGYERWTWTTSWASQVFEVGQITYPQNDLLELCYTLNGLWLQRRNPKLVIDRTTSIQREFMTSHPLYGLVEEIRRSRFYTGEQYQGLMTRLRATAL